MNGKKARLIRKAMKDAKIPNINREIKHPKTIWVPKIKSKTNEKERVTIYKTQIVNPFKSAYRKMKKAL